MGLSPEKSRVECVHDPLFPPLAALGKKFFFLRPQYLHCRQAYSRDIWYRYDQHYGMHDSLLLLREIRSHKAPHDKYNHPRNLNCYERGELLYATSSIYQLDITRHPNS